MRFGTVALALLAVTMAQPAAAARKTEKELCLQKVNDVETMKADPASASPGPKAEAKVADLIEIATHLCEQGNFKYADDLLALARGMLASE